jgi:putative FmdB family regulatory protein
MPIYEFKCKNCGNIFEYLCLRSDDRDNVHCPSCGHDEADVLLSAFSSMGSTPKTSSSTCLSSGGFS